MNDQIRPTDYRITNVGGEIIAAPPDTNDATIAAHLAAVDAKEGTYYLHNPNGRHAATLRWTPAQIQWKR